MHVFVKKAILRMKKMSVCLAIQKKAK